MNILSKPVRVRFAPSPTGHLHIGGLRTALFNWLFARHNNGTYLLRIEDTDIERSKQEYTDVILEAFNWTNIKPDEPIVIQSERYPEHAAVIEQLIHEGKAYRCYCPANERMDESDFFAKYPGTCRTKMEKNSSEPHVVRFKVPDTIESVSFDDIIRGTITFDRSELDDFVIARSDGRPIYNFVVVIDDAFMRITHVIRGEEHISNTPKQILLYQACGYTLPQFAHLPMILGASGQKLSKRDAATSVLDYRTNGYLPDALINYLVRLGWAHGDQEIFTRQELINYFTLEQVQKKGAIFDQAKLDWINSTYMRAMDDQALYDYMCAYVMSDCNEQLHRWNNAQILLLIKLYKERTKTVRELAQELLLLYKGPDYIPQEEISTNTDVQTAEYLRQLIKMLEDMSSFEVNLLADAIKSLCKRLNIKLVQLALPIRLALLGKTVSPGIFELLSVVGKTESVRRLNHLIELLEKGY